jgi:hypothetical protein
MKGKSNRALNLSVVIRQVLSRVIGTGKWRGDYIDFSHYSKPSLKMYFTTLRIFWLRILDDDEGMNKFTDSLVRADSCCSLNTAQPRFALFPSTVAHALGFPVFTCRLLTTISIQKLALQIIMKSSLISSPVTPYSSVLICIQLSAQFTTDMLHSHPCTLNCWTLLDFFPWQFCVLDSRLLSYDWLQSQSHIVTDSQSVSQ